MSFDRLVRTVVEIGMRGKLLATVGDVGHPLRRVLAGQSSSLRGVRLNTPTFSD